MALEYRFYLSKFDTAEEMRMKLLSQIKHIVQVIFDAPNYKVRVGAFTRSK